MVQTSTKTLIAPLQFWLLNGGWCAGCGRPLCRGTKVKYPKNGAYQVTCNCRRVYVYHPKEKSYRRALTKEVMV